MINQTRVNQVWSGINQAQEPLALLLDIGKSGISAEHEDVLLEAQGLLAAAKKLVADVNIELILAQPDSPYTDREELRGLLA